MADTIESQLLSALKTVQDLRSSVGHVIEKLADGLKNSSKTVVKEKVFLSEVQSGLITVNKYLR